MAALGVLGELDGPLVVNVEHRRRVLRHTHLGEQTAQVHNLARGGGGGDELCFA